MISRRAPLVYVDSSVSTCHAVQHGIASSFLSRTDLAMDAHWLREIVSKNTGEVHDCYAAESAAEPHSIHRLGSDGPWSPVFLAVIERYTE